jgi:hypothetical protein
MPVDQTSLDCRHGRRQHGGAGHCPRCPSPGRGACPLQRVAPRPARRPVASGRPARGRKGGRKKKVSDEQRAVTIDPDRQKQQTAAEISQMVGLMSRATFDKIIKERKAKGP